MLQFVVMDTNTLITIGVSIAAGAGAGFLTVTFMLGQYKQKVDRNEKDIQGNSKKINEINEKLCTMGGRMEQERFHQALTSPTNPDFVRQQSPLSLTEKGELLFKESGGHSYLEKYQSELIEEIRANNPSSAYDVQELARLAVASKQNTNEFIPMKDYAFKHGTNLNDIIQVMAIPLRDKALSVLGFDIKDLG